MDVLPEKIGEWSFIEAAARDTAALFGFSEIRFPTFENTELFRHGVGETTDVVQKEMFTFEHGKNSFALRPEGTASTVRLFLSNGLQNEPMPVKLFYITSCFRGERPQAGRLREFHQFGAELFGAADASADAEMIMFARSMFENLGVKGLRLEINSIGCPDCRKEYQNALHSYFTANKDKLCDTCLGRLDRNPMRILDCKCPQCSKVAENAPKVTDYICGECRNHFAGVRERLETLGVDFAVNTSIVRGLDYYTRTVFEFIDEKTGLTLCGGGRYDGLVEQLGGSHVPALGFAMGIERLIMVMEQQGCDFDKAPNSSLYIVTIGDKAEKKAIRLAAMLREQGMKAEYDLLGRSVKAQMKYAGRNGFAFTVVIGDDELETGEAQLKNMSTGEITSAILDESFAGTVEDAMTGLAAERLEHREKSKEENNG